MSNILKVFRGDRTVIYPQRMELAGDETLLDILAMYPDLMEAGFDGYSIKPKGGDRTTFFNVRLSPVIQLPQALRLSAKLIWYSNKSPYRIVAGNTAFYGALQAYKQLGRNWTLLAEWHDMFYGQRSAALAGIRFGF